MITDKLSINKREFTREITNSETDETILFEKRKYLFEDLCDETEFIEWVKHFEMVWDCSHKDSYVNFKLGVDSLYLFREMVFKIKELIYDKTPLMDFIDEITEDDEDIKYELHGEEESIGFLDIIEFYELEHDCLKIGELVQ